MCAVRTGVTLRRRPENKRERGVLAIQQSDILAEGVFDQDQAIRLDIPVSPQHFVAHDELLFCSRAFHWAACVPGDIGEPLLAVAPLFILRPASVVLPDYLAWCVNRAQSRSYFDREAVGTGVKMITKNVLMNLQLELPALAAQRQIVAAAACAQRELALSLQRAALLQKIRSSQLDLASLGGPAVSEGSAK